MLDKHGKEVHIGDIVSFFGGRKGKIVGMEIRNKEMVYLIQTKTGINAVYREEINLRRTRKK